MPIPHFVYSSADGHLGCFYFMATMNNAVQIFVYMFLNELMLSDFLVIYLEVKILSHAIFLWGLHPMSHILWDLSILPIGSMNHSSSVWAPNIVCTLAFQCCFLFFFFFSRTLGNFFPWMHKSILSQKDEGTPLQTSTTFCAPFPPMNLNNFAWFLIIFFCTQQGC